MKIYIAGRMTGIKDYNFPAFYASEEKLKKMFEEVINPAKISALIAKLENTTIDKISRKLCMREDIRQLLMCDAIYMLQGWEDSQGATLEHEIAKAIGLRIYYEEENNK